MSAPGLCILVENKWRELCCANDILASALIASSRSRNGMLVTRSNNIVVRGGTAHRRPAYCVIGMRPLGAKRPRWRGGAMKKIGIEGVAGEKLARSGNNICR